MLYIIIIKNIYKKLRIEFYSILNYIVKKFIIFSDFTINLNKILLLYYKFNQTSFLYPSWISLSTNKYVFLSFVGIISVSTLFYLGVGLLSINLCNFMAVASANLTSTLSRDTPRIFSKRCLRKNNVL